MCGSACVQVRKHISEKFASRYYDSIAPAINIFAEDYRLSGDAIRTWAFDGSLPVGTFMSMNQYLPSDLIVDIDTAISQVSQLMTIRQGDLIFIERKVSSRSLVREEVLSELVENEEVLYCKIK